MHKGKKNSIKIMHNNYHKAKHKSELQLLKTNGLNKNKQNLGTTLMKTQQET